MDKTSSSTGWAWPISTRPRRLRLLVPVRAQSVIHQGSGHHVGRMAPTALIITAGGQRQGVGCGPAGKAVKVMVINAPPNSRLAPGSGSRSRRKTRASRRAGRTVHRSVSVSSPAWRFGDAGQVQDRATITGTTLPMKSGRCCRSGQPRLSRRTNSRLLGRPRNRRHSIRYQADMAAVPAAPHRLGQR